MPIFLSLDTSADYCSVALSTRKQQIIKEHHGFQEHSLEILPLIESVFQEGKISLTDIDAIAFGAGPGAFTGLRIACGIAQGLGLALNKPLIAIHNLMAIAQAAVLEHSLDFKSPLTVCIVALIDARMQETYAGAYLFEVDVNRNAYLSEFLAPVLLSNQDVSTWIEEFFTMVKQKRSIPSPVKSQAFQFWVCGDVAADSLSLPSDPYIISIRSNAIALGVLAKQFWDEGKVISASQASPLYVREKVALTTIERLTL